MQRWVYWINKARYRELHEKTRPDVPFKTFERDMETLLEALTEMKLRFVLQKKVIHGKRPFVVWVDKSPPSGRLDRTGTPRET